MEYIRRIADDVIDERMEAFNAIHIVGPKGCGKTRTAKERCQTIIEFQDEEKRANYLELANTVPNLLLRNPKPILFDEWQDAVKIWGAVRKACDDSPESVGEYYLTGSSSRKVDTPHTGTGRITELRMYPMTLFEMGESNGTVSLTHILEDAEYEIDGMVSEIELEQLFFAVCCGGWPRCLALRKDSAKLEIAKDYYHQICQRDLSALDGVKRNPEWGRMLLWSYARNMATTAKLRNIFADVQSTQMVTDNTLAAYVEVLKALYVLEDIDAWTPHLRSKTAIRSAKKHIFVDPSIGLAALGVGPEYFSSDIDLFGHAFENLVLRDLQAFAQKHDARLMHYTDDTGLEADAVYQLADGRYALIEIKVGMNRAKEAEQSLLRFRDVIRAYNEKAIQNPEHPRDIYLEPTALIVICANATMAYTMASGVKVVPVGCLRD